MITLLCTVRDCRRPLERRGRQFVCEKNHSFDIARSGYVNLLQPQDRRSRTPGDSATSLEARRRLHQDGITRPLIDATAAFVQTLQPQTLLDVGCGEGSYLSSFEAVTNADLHGTDISADAVDLAARLARRCFFVVANADRFLPYADASFELLTSITSRIHREEFARVLQPGGALLVALPAPTDLIELRAAILGEGVERDRTQRTIDDLQPSFVLHQRRSVSHRVDGTAEVIADLLASTYRGQRRSESARLVEPMRVTLAHDLLLFRRT